jgi:hypothetical protein
MSKEDYKEQAGRLALHLANKHGVKLKPAATLELVAAMYGARDWNTLAASPGRSTPAGLAASDTLDVSPGEALFRQILSAGAESFTLRVVRYEHPLVRLPKFAPGVLSRASQASAPEPVKVRELSYRAGGLSITAGMTRELGADLCAFLSKKTQQRTDIFDVGTVLLGEFEYEFGDKVHQVRFRSIGQHTILTIEVEFEGMVSSTKSHRVVPFRLAQPQGKGELHLMPSGVRQEHAYSVARFLGVTDLRWAGSKWVTTPLAEFGDVELWFVRVDSAEEARACEALVQAGHRVLARVAGETVPEAVEQLKQWGLGPERLEKILSGVWGMPTIELQ